ncbi:Zinc finger CCCH domain-containing protein 7 [Platanthera zijinensis]|uniref:Zinc finger CCCH domain-containing protein 7 n=1 Tax=Platanthera zijinensis TaxID=2320716 RepID=A0AAP0FZY4_9ASPA
MESILRRTEIEHETLNPQSQKFSVFSSYAPRRSHLDSASYRSLVRILSCCLDHSLVPPPAPVDRTLEVINPNLNGGTSMEGQEKGDRSSDGGGHEGSLVAAAELVGIDPALFDDEFEVSVNSDLLSRFMSDCERLMDVPNEELRSSGELHEEKVHVDHVEIVDKDVEITKTCIKEVSEVDKGDANSEYINSIPDSDSLIGEPNSELCSILQSHVGNGQSGQQEIADNDLGILKVCLHGAVPRVSDLEDANNKLLSRVLPDCKRTIDVPNGELCSSGESNEMNEKTDHKQIVENGFKITEVCFNDAEKGNFKPGEVSTVTKGGANNELLNRRVIDAPNRKLHLTFESHDENGQSVLEEIAGIDPGITKVSVLGTQEEFPNIVEISEVFKGDGNHVLLNKVILDGSRLIDAPNGELQSSAGPHDRNVQGGYEKIMDNDMISKALVYGAKDGISDLGKILEVVEEDELGRIQPNVSVGAHNSMKESEGRRKTTGDVGDEKIEVIKQTTYAKSPSLMDWSDMRNLEEDQVNTLVHQIDEGCFEEGEIPDEIQDLEGQIDFNDEERVRGPTENDFKEVASTSTFVHKKDVLEHGTGYQPSTVERRAAVDYEANPSDTSENDSTDEETHKKQMVMNAKEKKQRGPLTEERKAKKKIAKKRKRAQKNREQGVKKLKLHTITKPKEVKICNFYLMGRCQQSVSYLDRCSLLDSPPCSSSEECESSELEEELYGL